MPKLINLRPIQTGDACYLTDHHSRDGECIITITMMDGTDTWLQAEKAICEAILGEDRIPAGAECSRPDLDSVAQWCADQWQLAQADMPPQVDRDTDGDDSERYLDCHILATWEV